MVTFVLPGFSAGNQVWLEETARNLKVDGEIRPIYWDHWREESKKFDPMEKARLLSDLAPNLFVTIVAKSVGVLVASYIIQRLPEQIKKVIFCGIPFNDLSPEERDLVKNTIKTCEGKVICFQNEEDPHGTYEQVKDFGKIISKQRNDHEYPYFEEFNDFLNEGNLPA